MNATTWAYHKIVVWFLWRVVRIYSPSLTMEYGVVCPALFVGAGSLRDHRFAGLTLPPAHPFITKRRGAVKR